jgi:hypothetical protein
MNWSGVMGSPVTVVAGIGQGVKVLGNSVGAMLEKFRRSLGRVNWRSGSVTETETETETAASGKWRTVGEVKIAALCKPAPAG